MRRGFKASSERIAAELRSELGLTVVGRLDPMQLADYLAIPVLTIGQLAVDTRTDGFAKYFTESDPDSFSAVTIFRGYRRIIVHNESHHPNRQASNLAHELSHSILEHGPAPVADAGGQRYWDPEVEAEASWLGAALLVPREGALALLKRNWSLQRIATHFGVSDSLCQWRIRQTGVVLQVKRFRTIYGRAASG